MQETDELRRFTPLDYFQLSQTDMVNNVSDWPWTAVGVAEFVGIAESVTTAAQYQQQAQLIGVVISVPGIFSCFLAMCTLRKKAFGKTNRFFQTMFAISVADALFQVTYLAYSCSYRTVTVFGNQSSAIMWLAIVLRSITYCISLFSNFLALWLTLERSLTVACPHFLQNMHHRTRLRLNVLVGVAIALLSSLRCHNTLTLSVVAKLDSQGNLRYLYEPSPLEEHPAVVGLIMFSDIVLPFVLVACMCLLSTALIVALIRRRKLPNSVGPVSETNSDEPPSRHRSRKRRGHRPGSMTCLTAILDGLFIFNQAGYCAEAAINLILRQISVAFDDPAAVLRSWAYYKRLSYNAALCSIVLECLSHTLNFPMYVVFSKSIKMEMRQFCTQVWRHLIKRA